MRESKYNEKEIKKAINNYVNDEIYQYALMIDGDWGSGKTYFIKNSIIPELEEKKVVYVSLYGIKNIEEINKLLFMDYIVKSEKIKKIEGVLEPGANILSGIVSPYIPGLSSIRGKKNLKLMVGLMVEFIKAKNILYIFDDLERCCCPITEIFGYLNILVEQNKNKVILITNETKIINQYVGNEIYEKGENRQNDLININNAYLPIKEKLVGITLHFYPNLKEIMTSIVKKNQSLEKKLQDELLKNLSQIEKEMSEKHHNNLRTFQFYLSKLNRLYQDIKKEQYNNEEEIYRKILIELFNACVNLKKGENIEEGKVMFGFVISYVTNNVYDKEAIVKEIKRYDDILTFEKQNPEDAITKLKYFCFSKDKEIEIAMTQILNRLENDDRVKNDKNLHLEMLFTFITYNEEIGIALAEIQRLEKMIEQKFEISKSDIDIHIYDNSSSANDFYQTLSRIRVNQLEYEFAKLQHQIEGCLEEENWVIELRKLLDSRNNEEEKNKSSFLNEYNLDHFLNMLNMSKAEQLIQFKELLKEVYRKEQKVDLELLKKFSHGIKQLKESSNEKIQKYHLDIIQEEIEKDIVIQKNILSNKSKERSRRFKDLRSV